MKYFVYFSLFIMVFGACWKEPPKVPLPDGYWGEASAARNGKPWEAHPACWISLVDHKHLVVELDSFVDNYYLKESLIMVDIPPFPGTYKVHSLTLEKNLNSSLSFWDADLPLGGCSLFEPDSNINLVNLITYDTLSKEITGTFHLTYIVHSKPFPNYPDTIRFTNGKFHGKIFKK